MDMAIWLVGNPAAGDDERGAGYWSKRLAGVGVEVDDLIEPNALDEADIARDDLVLAAGGDGTVQAVAAACARADAVLAVLPSGTANDFARSLGLDDDPDAACRAVTDDRRVRVDLARIGGRVFVNVAHAGLGAQASRAVGDEDKKWFGPLSYAGRLVDRWREHRGTRGELRCDDETFSGRWLEVGIANGAFYGGGHRVPGAVVDDGKLDIYAVRADHPVRLAWTFAAVRLLGPDRVRSRKLVHCRATRMAFSTHDPVAVTADGEDVGTTPIEIELEAGALKVVCGTGAGAFAASMEDSQ